MLRWRAEQATFTYSQHCISRVERDGTRTIPEQGVHVQGTPSITYWGSSRLQPDGADGVLLYMKDELEAEVYVQRLDPSGSPKWPAPLMVSWLSPNVVQDWHTGIGHDARCAAAWSYGWGISMARFDTTGNLLDQNLAVIVAHDPPAVHAMPHVLVVDGGVVSWSDTRGSSSGHSGVYMQHYGPDGTAQLMENGVSVMDAEHNGTCQPVAVHAAPGSIIHIANTSGDLPGINYGLRAMRTNLAGEHQWPDTVRFCTPAFAPTAMYFWQAFADGDGGATAVWEHAPSQLILASHLSRNGELGVTTGVNGPRTERWLTAHPCPASDRVSFDLPASAALLSLQVFDQLGELVRSHGDGPTYDVASLPTGIYVARINTTKGEFVCRFLVN